MHIEVHDVESDEYKIRIDHGKPLWKSINKSKGVSIREIFASLLNAVRVADEAEADMIDLFLDGNFDRFIIDSSIDKYEEPDDEKINELLVNCLPANSEKHLEDIKKLGKLFTNQEISIDECIYYDPSSENYKYRSQAVNSFPLLFKYFADSDNREIQELIDNGASINEYLKNTFNLSKIQLNRMRKYKTAVPDSVKVPDNFNLDQRYSINPDYKLDLILKRIGELDPTWCPLNQEEWEAFILMNCCVFSPISLYLGIDWKLLASATKGKWIDYKNSFIKSLNLNNDEVDTETFLYTTSGIIEFIEDFARNVMVVNMPDDTSYKNMKGTELGDMMKISSRMFVYNKKNPITQLLKYYSYWTNNKQQLERYKIKPSLDSWLPLLSKNDTYKYNNVVFSNLVNASQLQKEGKEMSHCIGSYVSNCLTGRSHIFSIEDKDTKARATVQIKVRYEADIKRNELQFLNNQLRSKSNASASDEIQKAVEAFVDYINNTAKVVNIEKICNWINNPPVRSNGSERAETSFIRDLNQLDGKNSSIESSHKIWCNKILKGFKLELINRNPEYKQLIKEINDARRTDDDDNEVRNRR